jgi:hypothetical protein
VEQFTTSWVETKHSIVGLVRKKAIETSMARETFILAALLRQHWMGWCIQERGGAHAPSVEKARTNFDGQ